MGPPEHDPAACSTYGQGQRPAAASCARARCTCGAWPRGPTPERQHRSPASSPPSQFALPARCRVRRPLVQRSRLPRCVAVPRRQRAPVVVPPGSRAHGHARLLAPLSGLALDLTTHAAARQHPPDSPVLQKWMAGNPKGRTEADSLGGRGCLHCGRRSGLRRRRGVQAAPPAPQRSPPRSPRRICAAAAQSGATRGGGSDAC